jgi:hypothetical protein
MVNVPVRDAAPVFASKEKTTTPPGVVPLEEVCSQLSFDDALQPPVSPYTMTLSDPAAVPSGITLRPSLYWALDVAGSRRATAARAKSLNRSQANRETFAD